MMLTRRRCLACAGALVLATAPAAMAQRHGGHHGGHHGGYHHGHRGGGWGGAGVGFAAGALLGSALAAPRYGYAYAPGPAYDDATAYCLQRFKSYDPASGTYLGYDGYRHPCP